MRVSVYIRVLENSWLRVSGRLKEQTAGEIQGDGLGPGTLEAHRKESLTAETLRLAGKVSRGLLRRLEHIEPLIVL